jgi:hypothetical protein
MNGERAETYLRLLAEAALRDPRPGEALNRVRHAAGVLGAIAAVDGEVADSVTRDLEAALAARSRLGRGALHAPHPEPERAMMMRMRAARLAEPAVPPAPQSFPDPVVAVPAGQVIVAREGDFPGSEIVLLALVIAEGKGVISIASRVRGPHPPTQARLIPMNQLSAADDAGRRYGVRFSGEVGSSWKDGRLDLYPAPPPGVRWIEVFTEAEGPRIRIDCTAGPPDVVVSSEPQPRSSPGERLLDSAAESILIGAAGLHGRDDPRLLAKIQTGLAGPLTGDLDGTIAALEAVGALRPDSPAPKRLAALRQAFFGDMDKVSPGSAMASLPEEWASVLAYRYRRSWPRIPDGFAPVTAVLPELDGVRFIVSGMRSDAEGTVLYAHFLGLEPARHSDEPGGGLGFRFALWIRDNAGHWHLAMVRNWTTDDSGRSCQLGVVPPLHGAATSLEFVLTGLSGRVRAVMPLDWTNIYE